MKFNGSSRQIREAVAQSGTVLAGVLILVVMQATVLQHDLPVQETPINLTLLAEAVKPEKIIEPPVSKAATPKIEKRVATSAIAEPVIAAPVQTSQSAGVQAAAVNEKAAAPVVTESPLPAKTADVEAMYVAKIRGYLVSAKRYPTGREASMRRPTGKSRVWFILRRNGELIDAGIEEGSGSMLLDGSALTTVRRASYTAFPDEAWAGQTQHKFSVELEFVPPPL